MEPFIPDTLGTASSIRIKGGVIISELFYTLFYVAGTMHGVRIKGAVLISGSTVVLSLNLSWGI